MFHNAVMKRWTKIETAVRLLHVYHLIISDSFEKYITVVLWDSITRIGKQTPLYCHSILHLILLKAFGTRKTISKAERVRLETLGANIIFKSVDTLAYK